MKRYLIHFNVTGINKIELLAANSSNDAIRKILNTLSNRQKSSFKLDKIEIVNL